MAYDDDYKSQGCGPQIPACLDWDAPNKQYVLTNPNGVQKFAPADLDGEVVEADDGKCYLRLLFNNQECARVPLQMIVDKFQHPDFDFEFDSVFDANTCELRIEFEGEEYDVDMLPFLQQIELDYDPALHMITHSIKGNVVKQLPLNCSQFDFNPATCQLTHTNEKNVARSWFIPQDSYAYDPATCTLAILTAKGQSMVIPTGVPVSEVNLSLAPNCDGCTLRFKYKGKICDVALPNMIVGCEFNPATNVLRMIHCDGAEKAINFPKATLQCNVLPDGTQVLYFDNGCPGGQKMFNIPGVVLDTDALTVVGSTLTFTYGGDGNTDVVVIDICDIVAQNCNATFTAINPDGSWSFVDNAGNPFDYPAPKNCCTYFGPNPTVLDGNTPTTPAGAWPTKTDGDTAIECHPNGLSFWTCANGTWINNFTKAFPNCCHYQVVEQTPIDPAALPPAPPVDPKYADKNDGDTVLVCHPNGQCAYTCVNGQWALDFCKVDPEAPDDCCHYHFQQPNQYDVNNPPPVFGNGPATAGTDKSDGDTLHIRYTNGSCYFTCKDGAWVLDFCVADPIIPEPSDSCCGYFSNSTQPVASGSVVVPPTAVKADGNTITQCHPDGITGWTCVNGQWAKSMVCPFPQSVPSNPEVHIGDDAPDKAAGFKVWFNCDDGCVYYCQDDGSWLGPKGCPQPQPEIGDLGLKKKGGASFNPEADRLLTLGDNPFNEFEHDRGGLNLLRCDGSGVCLVPSLKFKGSPGGVQAIDGTFEPGPLLGTESCHTFRTPKCGPHRVRLEFTIGYNKTGGFQSNATVSFHPEYSITGGALWSNFATSGVDTVVQQGSASALTQEGEQDFTDYVYPNLAGDTEYTVCARTKLNGGNIIQGGITAFASTFRSTWTELNCCPIAAAG